nr:hypothetical protein [Oscillatoria laete-virens]
MSDSSGALHQCRWFDSGGRNGKKLSDYPHSSHLSYCRGREKIGFVNYDHMLGFTNINNAHQHDYESTLRAICREGQAPDLRSQIRASLVLGNDQLLQRARHEITRKSNGLQESKWLRSEESRQRAEQIARRIPDALDDEVKIWLRARVGGGTPHATCAGIRLC